MKTLIVAMFLVLLLLCLGCEEKSQVKEDPSGYKPMNYKPNDLTSGTFYYITTNVIVIDDCEYIVVSGSGKGIVHKANCKNPIHNTK
jgi:hypothetical protein